MKFFPLWLNIASVGVFHDNVINYDALRHKVRSENFALVCYTNK